MFSISDCTAPFEVNFVTDAIADANSATASNRGNFPMRIGKDYKAISCNFGTKPFLLENIPSMYLPNFRLTVLNLSHFQEFVWTILKCPVEQLMVSGYGNAPKRPNVY